MFFYVLTLARIHSVVSVWMETSHTDVVVPSNDFFRKTSRTQFLTSSRIGESHGSGALEGWSLLLSATLASVLAIGMLPSSVGCSPYTCLEVGWG